MERRINVRGIVVSDSGQILAAKHRDSVTNQESEYWATPGGGLDIGESVNDGIVREFEEELGVIPVVGRLLFMQQFISRPQDGRQIDSLELFYHIENTSDFQHDINLTTTSHGCELARVAFIDPAVSNLLPNFLQELDIRKHIDTRQPVLFVNNLHEKKK